MEKLLSDEIQNLGKYESKWKFEKPVFEMN